MSDNMINENAVATLKKGEGRALKAGGQWIYDNEIESVSGRFENGDIINVRDFDGYPMGSGFINVNSKIRIRMLTRKAGQAVDEEFLKRRVRAAWEYRKNVMPEKDLNCCRVIFGEADFLPGLTVDKYADVLVVECLALGMEPLKNLLVDSLKEILR